LLLSPQDGSRVTKPPLFRWVAVKGARYYNVQLYRGGQKVLSVWPSGNHYGLAWRWTYKNRHFSLTPGPYTWFVWPGIGPRSAAHYGKLLGRSSFVVLRAT